MHERVRDLYKAVEIVNDQTQLACPEEIHQIKHFYRLVISKFNANIPTRSFPINLKALKGHEKCNIGTQ